MRVYFDYNATTPLAPEVTDAVLRVMRDVYGNASSIHHFGQQAKATLDELEFLRSGDRNTWRLVRRRSDTRSSA